LRRHAKLALSRVAEVKSRISSVELLSTLKRSYSYKELSSILGLSAPILSRYVRGHVLPSPARSEKFVAVFREKLLKKMVTDHIRMTSDGVYDLTRIVLDVGLLKQIAKVVYSEFEPSHVEKVLTMEVDGVPLAVEIADEFNVGVAIAKTERDLAAEEFYEQRMVYTPDSIKYLYIPKASLKRGEHVLIVDDLIRSGVTLDALVRLAEKARVKPVGIFTIACVEQSLPRLKERMKLNCPIETLVTLDAPRKQYTF
jgi:adenine/guanine phosphoribosyltransferase-like PRPP-binding protein